MCGIRPIVALCVLVAVIGQRALGKEKEVL